MEHTSTLRQALKSLNVQREALEHESEAITSELTSRDPEVPETPPMGIDTPLVDAEGYPRNDIDVFRARTLRSRLAIIRTDHTKLMNDINQLLQQLAILERTTTTTTTAPEYNNNNNNNNKGQQLEETEEELRHREKPKPRFDPISGKWVVRNWDGTIAGIVPTPTTTATTTAVQEQQIPPRSFDDIDVDNRPTNNNDNNAMTSDEAPTSMEIVNDTNVGHSIQTMIHKSAVSISDVNGSGDGGGIVHKPWARVDSVADHSPASRAGLQVNDWIIAFGPICTTFDTDSLATLVHDAASNQEMIEILCRRDHSNSNNETESSSLLMLQLSPRPWHGRGLLGCHIVPC